MNENIINNNNYLLYMWRIHDKYYDLEIFKTIHPGGSKIIESCKNLDATAAFESYHAFCDIEKIKKIMEKYEVKNPSFKIERHQYTFHENDFYDELKNEVATYFKNKNTKWNYSWLLINIITFKFYILTFVYTFIGIENNFYLRMISSFLCGTTLISWMFQCYHDASHCAISYDKNVNTNLAILGSALGFWDWDTWSKHHSILHHSYTGDYNLDPDLKHTHPFFKKHENSKANLVNGNWIGFILSVFPGMYLGQILSYLLVQFKKKLWGFKINNTKTNLEIGIILFKVGIMLYGRSFLLILIFLLSLNLNYSIAILPDHDLYETKINHNKLKNDWGENQVRNSGNFANNNWLYTRLYGGINYQIEHHLFPSLCSYYLPEISNIVKEKCKKYKIEYVSIPNIWDAYFSSLKNIKLLNKN